jgi:hypothetical protein
MVIVVFNYWMVQPFSAGVMSSGIMVVIFMDFRYETKAKLRSVFWRRFSTLSFLNPEQLAPFRKEKHF